MSTYVSVVISPATTTRPVVIRVSHATRPSGSSASTASRTLSETWSAILSGWPSVTDSDVKRNSSAAIGGNPSESGLPDCEKGAELLLGSLPAGAGVHPVEVLEVARELGRSEEHTSELQSHSDLVCRLL